MTHLNRLFDLSLLINLAAADLLAATGHIVI